MNAILYIISFSLTPFPVSYLILLKFQIFLKA